MKPLAYVVSFLGSVIVYFVASIVLFDQINFFRSVVAFIVLTFLIVILRTIFTGHRPNAHNIKNKMHGFSYAKMRLLTQKIHELNKRKFASGHVARVLLLGLIYYSVFPEVYFLVIVLLVSLAVGASRVYLKYHGKWDVLTGLIVGGASLFIGDYVIFLLFS